MKANYDAPIGDGFEAPQSLQLGMAFSIVVALSGAELALNIGPHNVIGFIFGASTAGVAMLLGYWALVARKRRKEGAAK